MSIARFHKMFYQMYFKDNTDIFLLMNDTYSLA